VSTRLSEEREDQIFRVLRTLDKNPETSQRALSQELNLSLGAMNYTLNALIEKGWVEAKNFKRSSNRVSYAYMLTPRGIKEKGLLTVRFLKRKMQEYEALQREIEELKAEEITAGEVRERALKSRKG
jgi:EPS-associated MarR family transcriptional regulator